MKKFILGIETSCDDTSLCILQSENQQTKILAHLSYSQDEMLKKWGGVVPEIAARNHLEKITPILKEVFSTAKIKLKDINLIGVTTSPGLLGPLLTGVNAAKTLSMLSTCPITPINHLHAHLEAIHLTNNLAYPYLGLLVSGGHTLYIIVEDQYSFKIIGGTTDDAAGEAFDKAGKLLNIGYPAGKLIDDLAKKGNKNKFAFPIAMKNSKDSNLSFSGVKTSLKQFLDKHYSNKPIPKDELQDICASYQKAIIDALILKSKFALTTAQELTNKQDIPIVLGGGVACNSYLRSELKIKFKNVFCVEPKFCTDNGAMIANMALRTIEQQVNFPECLNLDATSTNINKKQFRPKK
ncbi:MAG: tRNA (adenosine(37)-N6)-threonylcarbamoyltransferase complex transferase subunit TsaD [Bdellovibrionales bacterium]|jgi:N6-L-threonylcarbamoyladenine synthase|nr:tRNA (adenosine(37)-N6)-threonylcarbamoyltransferase complex transferase subunit TsaD [Bdellovibrionales bacterium]